MTATQQEKAEAFRSLHRPGTPLVLPNAWDAASARVVEQAGFPAVATTSSGLAAALGYGDGQQITAAMLAEAIARINRVVQCPVTADIEAGYGGTIDEVLRTVRAVIAAGAIGFNIEDSLIDAPDTPADLEYQVELIAALRQLAGSLGVPFVINARIDIFLHRIGEPESRFEQTVRRANAYLRAGADCVYPIARLDRETIGNLVKAIEGPVNILGGVSDLTIPELAQLGVARVSYGGGLMSAALGHLRAMVGELRDHGSHAVMRGSALSGADFDTLFSPAAANT